MVGFQLIHVCSCLGGGTIGMGKTIAEGKRQQSNVLVKRAIVWEGPFPFENECRGNNSDWKGDRLSSLITSSPFCLLKNTV